MTTSGILGAAQQPIIPGMFVLGGYRVETRDDAYPDGTGCVVAKHPDLPGCVGYGADHSEALQSLEAARCAYITSLRTHGEEVPASLILSISGSAHWQLTAAPMWTKTTVNPTLGAQPALQTA
jgi:predicted RNase H-like HicB family nuclease